MPAAPTEDMIRLMLEALAGECARAVGAIAGPKIGFVVLLAPFGAESQALAYAANGNRSDCYRLIVEHLANLRRQGHAPAVGPDLADLGAELLRCAQAKPGDTLDDDLVRRLAAAAAALGASPGLARVDNEAAGAAS